MSKENHETKQREMNEFVKDISIFFLAILTIIAVCVMLCPSVIGRLSESELFENLLFYALIAVAIIWMCLLFKTMFSQEEKNENKNE